MSNRRRFMSKRKFEVVYDAHSGVLPQDTGSWTKSGGGAAQFGFNDDPKDLLVVGLYKGAETIFTLNHNIDLSKKITTTIYYFAGNTAQQFKFLNGDEIVATITANASPSIIVNGTTVYSSGWIGQKTDTYVKLQIVIDKGQIFFTFANNKDNYPTETTPLTTVTAPFTANIIQYIFITSSQWSRSLVYKMEYSEE